MKKLTNNEVKLLEKKLQENAQKIGAKGFFKCDLSQDEELFKLGDFVKKEKVKKNLFLEGVMLLELLEEVISLELEEDSERDELDSLDLEDSELDELDSLEVVDSLEDFALDSSLDVVISLLVVALDSLSLLVLLLKVEVVLLLEGDDVLFAPQQVKINVDAKTDADG